MAEHGSHRSWGSAVAAPTSQVSLYRLRLARFVGENPFYRMRMSQPRVVGELDSRLPFIYAEPQLQSFLSHPDHWPMVAQLVAGSEPSTRVGYLVGSPTLDAREVADQHSARVAFAVQTVQRSPGDALVVFLPGCGGALATQDQVLARYGEAISAVAAVQPDAEHLLVAQPNDSAFAEQVRTALRELVDLPLVSAAAF